MRSAWGVGCLGLVMMRIGLSLCIESVMAISSGKKVRIGRALRSNQAKVSPYFTLPPGALFVGLGVAGLVKAYRDKDKYPF
jgi:hypothetical protein